ncbi:hypothetical protein FQN55_004746 [Onygenales sp. PD_40]|nr:hypothetical protein FQN55_004746 [Onygenales sp. PD_40]
MISEPAKSQVPLNVIVVGAGAGIGGLSAAVALARRGHLVQVLESTEQLLSAGAGVVIPPTTLSWFQSEGILLPNDPICMPLEGFDISRWNNGEVIVRTPANPLGKQSTLHRGDLQLALLARARQMENITIRLNSRVVNVDFNETSVLLETGGKVAGDLIIAADGVKSTFKPRICPPEAGKAQPSGEAAFRIMLPREALEGDDELMGLLQQPRVKRWDGPDCHVVAYPVRNHELLNVVLIHLDDGRDHAEESWTSASEKQQVYNCFQGWDPLLHKIIDLSPAEVLNFRMFLHPASPVWTKGSVVLLGDACHAMLPYLGQGVAQAIEDVTAIAAVLSVIKTREDLPLALQAYETSRKHRVEQIQAAAYRARDQLHLKDGEAQAARDRERAAASKENQNTDVIKMQQVYWVWDAAQAAEKALLDLRKGEQVCVS